MKISILINPVWYTQSASHLVLNKTVARLKHYPHDEKLLNEIILKLGIPGS